MIAQRRARIVEAFSAARDYDRHAHVQRRAARDLAARIAALPLPERPRILEIGCGTGFLTQAMREQAIDGQQVISDVSPRMVERCRASFGEYPDCQFAVFDGETGTPPDAGSYDLVCANLAMQWFADLASALPRMIGWLKPGGHCLFTTLGSGSFAEWRAAHSAEGLPCGTPDFLSRAKLAAILPDLQSAPPRSDIVVERHRSGLDFLAALKAIGAGTPAQRHRPLSVRELKRVMRRFEAGGGAVSYEIVTCHFRRPGSEG